MQRAPSLVKRKREKSGQGGREENPPPLMRVQAAVGFSIGVWGGTEERGIIADRRRKEKKPPPFVRTKKGSYEQEKKEVKEGQSGRKRSPPPS